MPHKDINEKREYMRRYRKIHRKKYLQSSRAYYKRHRKKLLRQKREWAAKNRKLIALRQREYNCGWKKADIEKELVRQNYSCYGCLTRITFETCQVDHCHKKNNIRGLLCRKCNISLGHVEDNPATLRRLMAYLDHNRKVTNIYLIGSLKNSRIPEIGNRLRSEGYDVMDEWFTPGEFADENWQKYEKLRGRTYSEALRGRAATNIFLFDRSYLDLADVAVLVMPAGRSAMIELGYAKGRRKKAYILLDGHEPERYDIMPGFADKIFSTEEELFSELKK